MRQWFTIAALTLLSSVAAGAQQQELRQTPGSQIEVRECNPHRHLAGTPGHPWIDPYGVFHPAANFPYSEGFLAIGYVNRSPLTAKEVDFGLVARQTLVAVANDVGTFSPGAQIRHEFSVDPEVFPIGTSFPQCVVLRVKYADGSEWQNPSPPPAG